MVRVFTNGPGDHGSIPGRVIPKIKKWYLVPPCLTLSIVRYGSRVKWVNPGKGVAPSLTSRCSSYRKGNLWVTLDYGCQLYLHIKIHHRFSLTLCSKTLYPGFDTKLHLIARLQSESFEECRVLFHCHHSQVNSDLEC